ncbi:MAG: DUF3267 domain-containing protein [Sedimentisphaerales bacterium]|nr:DUF3267 domain-containing protein [Sedimentisphaerales bacterium]
MRFRIGPPPENASVVGDESTWHPLREPSPARFQLLAILTAVGVTVLITLALLTRDPELVLSVSWPIVMLFIVFVLPVHEFLHAVCFKGGVVSRQAVFGFYPKVLAFYAHCDGMLTRRRYIVISMFPFLVLTVLPLLLVTLIRVEWRYLVEVIFANGLASAGDVLTTIIIARQAPRQSILVNSGMKTYWRPAVPDMR